MPPFALFLSCLHSLSLSCPLSVTFPLFSARCDKLGDISPTDIPGDRTSSRLLLPPLSFSSPHQAVLSRQLLSPPRLPYFSPAVQTTDLAPLSFFFPPSISLSSLTAPTVTYQPQPFYPASLLSSILLLLFPFCSGYMLTVTHLPSSPLPSLLRLYSTPFFFPSPFLYLALSRLPFTMTDLSSPPVCQPFTCILATTSPLALVLHAEQANKMPGERRTSTLVYPPPSIRSVIPSHAKTRPNSAGVGG